MDGTPIVVPDATVVIRVPMVSTWAKTWPLSSLQTKWQCHCVCLRGHDLVLLTEEDDDDVDANINVKSLFWNFKTSSVFSCYQKVKVKRSIWVETGSCLLYSTHRSTLWIFVSQLLDSTSSTMSNPDNNGSNESNNDSRRKYASYGAINNDGNVDGVDGEVDFEEASYRYNFRSDALSCCFHFTTIYLVGFDNWNFSLTLLRQCRVTVVVAATCHWIYCRQQQQHGWKKNQLINWHQQEGGRWKEGTQSHLY